MSGHTMAGTSIAVHWMLSKGLKKMRVNDDFQIFVNHLAESWLSLEG